MSLDDLFKLPLAEFTAARNALVKRLQQGKRGDEAESVKALTRPSVSAWAVNQLYWNHRKEFDRLLAAGARLTQAHASQLSGKTVDIQEPTTARREAVSTLLRLAETVLIDNGHSASPDTMHRIATSLETLSTSSKSPDAPVPGHLTNDVGPLGFESWVTLVPAGKPRVEQKDKAALKAAERELHKTRALADEAAKNLKLGEKQYEKAKAVAEEAQQLVAELRVEAERSRKAAEDAERAFQIAIRES